MHREILPDDRDYLSNTNYGLILLYQHQEQPSAFYVDDVLAHDVEDPRLHNDQNTAWLKGARQREEGWSYDRLLLEEAAYSYHSVQDTDLFEVEAPITSKSDFFEETKRIFTDAGQDHITIDSIPRGYGIALDSGTTELTAVLFFLADGIEQQDVLRLMQWMVVTFRVIETAISVEMKQHIDSIERLGARYNSSYWVEEDRANELVDMFYKKWQPAELTVAKRSGPFVVVSEQYSRCHGERYNAGKQEDRAVLIYHQTWVASTLPQKRNGYIALAVTHDIPFYVPDIYSRITREHGTIPLAQFDNYVSVTRYDSRLQSQYTVFFRSGLGFHGVLNLAFVDQRPLWNYERRLIRFQLELLADYMHRIDWRETDYSVMSNACQAVGRLRRRVERLRIDDTEISQRERLSQLDSMLAQFSRQFVSRITGAGIPGLIQARKSIDRVVVLQQGATVKSDQSGIIAFKIETPADCQVRMLRGDFETILESLIDNAREAKGTELIRIAMEEAVWEHPFARKGWELCVYDDGESVDQNVKHLIFDRGSTTKTGPASVNMGIGLWMVDQLCRDYNLNVEHREDVGRPYKKAFAVFFPRQEIVG